MGSAESNLASNLVRTATSMPDRPALKVNGQDITYQQLHGLAAKLAGSLRAHGIEPGDRVALILPNVPAFPVAFYATLLAGGVVVPMNPLLKAGEIDFFFTNSGAKVAFVWPDFVGEATKGAATSGTKVIECGPMGPVEGVLPEGEAITEPTEREGDDTAIILYTSGTTGRPKGAELTHDNVGLNAKRCAEGIQQISSDDIVRGVLAMLLGAATASWAACRSSTSSASSSGSAPRSGRVPRSPSSPASTPQPPSPSSAPSG